MSRYPFGIGFRLFTGTGLIVLVAIVLAVTFVLVVGRFQDNFRSVTERNLPAITAAAQLSRLSNSIASQGPWMFAANSEWIRQTAYSRALDEANWLENLLNDMSNTAIDQDTKAVFLDLSRRLLDRYAQLDALTRQRIAIARTMEGVQARIETLVPGLANVMIGTPDGSDWRKWGLGAHELLKDLMAASRQPHLAPLRQLQATALARLDAIEAIFARLPPPVAARLAASRGELLELTSGDQSTFRMQERHLDVTDKIASNLEAIATIADEFLAVSTNATFKITSDLETDARLRGSDLEALTSSVMILVVFSATLAATLFAYIYRQVIVRLRRLQDDIRRSARGDATGSIEVAGRDELGEVARGLQFFIDTIRQREEALLAAKEHAERASTDKTNFLASASHDLRQPLQALNLFITALEDQEHDADKRRLIDRIRDSLGALGTLLDSLLDVSKLEAGLVVPEMEAFPIDLILDRLNGEFTEVARAKGLKYRGIGAPLMVRSDPGLLETILRNLIANAVKYTETGGVLVGCRQRGGHLRIEVWDTGVGIPEEQLSLIFHDFYQIHNPNRDRAQGLGLGLSIVERVARLLQCRVTVSSRPGRGSVFRVSVPLAPTSALPTVTNAAPSEDESSEAFVVVIDDELDILDAMELVLTGWGYRCLTLSCVKCAECDERLLKSHRPPDLLIVDYRLGRDINGVQAVTMIREWFHKDIPALLITGDTAPDRLRDVRDSGLPVLNKPVQTAELRAMIETLLRGAPKGDRA